MSHNYNLKVVAESGIEDAWWHSADDAALHASMSKRDVVTESMQHDDER